MSEPTKQEKHKCEHPCCNANAIPCRLNDPETNKDVICFYCPEHAFINGFCSCCGEFWGGIESFDIGSGICENCLESVDDDFIGGDEEA